jgi:chitodextrinase
MATKTKDLPCNLSVISRIQKDGLPRQTIGKDQHLLVGPTGSGTTEYRHRSFIRFDMSSKYWGDVKKVVRAELLLRVDTNNPTHWSAGSTPEIGVRQVTRSFAEVSGSENKWVNFPVYATPNAYWPTLGSTLSWTKVPRTDNSTVAVNVTPGIRNYLPKTVLDPTDAPGLARTNYGWALLSRDEYNNNQRVVFISRHHGTTTARPILRIYYEPKDAKPDPPSNMTPTGDISFDTPFEGQHNDPSGLPMEARLIHIYLRGGTTPLWSLAASDQAASPPEVSTGRFSVLLQPQAGLLKSQTDYEWTAQTRNSVGWSDQSARVPFRITSFPPQVVAQSLGSVPTLAGVRFGGQYSDPDGDLMQGYRIQLRASAPAGDPIWDADLPLWDTGRSTPTLAEHDGNYVAHAYSGRSLPAGDYSFRVKVEDYTGVWSAWSYATVTLTEDYVADPGDYEYATFPDREAPVRIALYKMGAKRGPGVLLGYVNDPINLGASMYLNGGGELFFTLPATHPMCPEIEPNAVHYAVEQWWGDRYRALFAGLITDFDATPDEAVFYGTDYLGLFQTCVDERYNEKNINEPAPKGSKYVNKELHSIIRDQLTYHVGLPDSRVGFLKIGAISAMPERATIYSTYVEALPFMTGILDSHKQGTGKECRLFVRERNPNDYEVAVVDGWGRDRPNIRLQYGGLLNGFRVVALGDFGTRVLGVGQKRGEVTVYRATGQSVPPLAESRWGRVSKTRFYPDIIDQADLQRRANEAASQVGKVGKRMALAIRADGLAVFDGWDIGDNIMIDIDRGVVDTYRYGSEGFWTVLGVEFRAYPDGHYDTTLTVLPKKTATAADADLIPSRNPGVSLDWQVGYGMPLMLNEPPSIAYHAETHGPFSWAFSPDFPGGTSAPTTDPNIHPASSDPVVAWQWLDLNTGCVWQLNAETLKYEKAYCPPSLDDIPDVPDIPGWVPDATPPAAPSIIGVTSSEAKYEDGSSLIRLNVTVGYPTPPTGMDDLSAYIVEATRFTLQGTPDPDWGQAQEVSHISPDATGVLTANVVVSPVLAQTDYWVRVCARDKASNRSGWSAIVNHQTARDNDAPSQPTDATVFPSLTGFGARWSSVGATDLAYYEVRWRRAGTQDAWDLTQIKGTVVVVGGLVNGARMDVQVRSVDLSGNTLNDTGTVDADLNPVYESVLADDNPDAGWVTAIGSPVTVGATGDMLVWDAATIAKVFAGNLTADVIQTGSLTVGGQNGLDGINFVDATGKPVGSWTPAGIVIQDPANATFRLVITKSGLQVLDYTNPANPIPVVTIGPNGIDAASITFGNQRGGHNLVTNSSFELGPLGASAAELFRWDVRSDWDATRVGADVNITQGDGDFSMTATS